jgi:hypothetical protein
MLGNTSAGLLATPLEGIRVLDLTHALAGPYCTLLLADYGAEIYKLEARSGDMGRGWGPPFAGGESSFFLGLNRGKRGISIDLKQPEGLDLCLRLLDKMDVLIEKLSRRRARTDRARLRVGAKTQPAPGVLLNLRLWPGQPVARRSRHGFGHAGLEWPAQHNGNPARRAGPLWVWRDRCDGGAVRGDRDSAGLARQGPYRSRPICGCLDAR